MPRGVPHWHRVQSPAGQDGRPPPASTRCSLIPTSSLSAWPSRLPHVQSYLPAPKHPCPEVCLPHYRPPVTTDTATSPRLQLKAARPACRARSRHAPSSLGVWVTNRSMPRSPLILPPDWPLHPINSVLAAPPLGHCPDTAPRGPRASWLWPAALGSFHLHSRQSQLVSLTASPTAPLPMGLTTSSLAQSEGHSHSVSLQPHLAPLKTPWCLSPTALAQLAPCQEDPPCHPLVFQGL